VRRGYIKLYRKAFDNPLYFSEKFTKFQAWTDLLLMANHKDAQVSIRGILVKVNRGQVLASEEYLAERWKWSRGKVRRFMQSLANPLKTSESSSGHRDGGKTGQQIVQQKTNVTTIITITNYEEYQGDGTTDGTTSSTAESQQTDTLKNDKNNKNIIYKGASVTNDKDFSKASRFKKPTQEEVTEYTTERGYSIDPGYFWHYYEARGWRFKNGQKMKSWKSALATFEKNAVKYENKPREERKDNFEGKAWQKEL